jgi:hypothetical protein
MARMRKTKLTMQMVETAIELKKAGMYDKYIIAALGVNPSTFYRWMADGETARQGSAKRALCDGIKKAEGDFVLSLSERIWEASKKPQHWTAAAWLLERTHPDEYGKAERKTEDANDAPMQLMLDFPIEPMADEEGGDERDAGDQG